MARVTPAEIARLRGCSRQAVSNAIRKGRIVLESDGSIDLTRSENFSYLQHTAKPGPKVAGAKPKATRPRKAPRPAPEIVEGDQDEDALPPEVFVEPEGSGYAGRLEAQCVRVRASIQLAEYRFKEWKSRHLPTELAVKFMGEFFDKLQAMTTVPAAVDWAAEPLHSEIDRQVDIVFAAIRSHFRDIGDDRTPRQPEPADTLESMTLDELKSRWDETCALKTLAALGLADGTIMSRKELERRVGALSADLKIIFLDIGRRCGAHANTLVRSVGADEARGYLAREIASGLERVNRHRMNQTG